jgi:hypothetical protein
MPVRITQMRVEQLRQGGNAQQGRVTQLAVEIADQPNQTNQQRMMVTQIAIEFPFTGQPSPGPPPPPPPTQGDTPPAGGCAPPPTSECVTTPALQVTDETCEQLGS